MVAVGYRLDGEPAGRQDIAEQLSVEIVVLDNENSLRHCAPDASTPAEAYYRDHYLLNGRLTIIKQSEDSVKDPTSVALKALAWVLADTTRAGRFIELTGLTPDGLRSAIGESATHRAVLDFLCGHEPDLVAAAEALGLEPAALAAAREGLA